MELLDYVPCDRSEAGTGSGTDIEITLAAGGKHASGSLATLTSQTILPVSSTMQTLVSLTETSSPAKCSMLRFSF